MMHVFYLFPLDLSSSIAPSFQSHPVFDIAAERVPPNDAASRLSGFGDRSWDSFKNSFKTQGIEFSFLSQRALRMVFADSIAPKTPVSKLKRPFVC